MEKIQMFRWWRLIDIFTNSIGKKQIVILLCIIMLLSDLMLASNCPASIPTAQYTVYHQDTIHSKLNIVLIHST